MRGKRNTPAVFSLRSSTAGVPLEAGTEPAEGDAVIHPADLGGAGVSAPPWTPARADHALRGEGGPAPSVGDRAALTAAPPCRRLWRYASPQGRSGPPPPPSAARLRPQLPWGNGTSVPLSTAFPAATHPLRHPKRWQRRWPQRRIADGRDIVGEGAPHAAGRRPWSRGDWGDWGTTPPHNPPPIHSRPSPAASLPVPLAQGCGRSTPWTRTPLHRVAGAAYSHEGLLLRPRRTPPSSAHGYVTRPGDLWHPRHSPLPCPPIPPVARFPPPPPIHPLHPLSPDPQPHPPAI